MHKRKQRLPARSRGFAPPPQFSTRRVHRFDGFSVSGASADGTACCVGASPPVRYPRRPRFGHVCRREAGNLRRCLCACRPESSVLCDFKPGDISAHKRVSVDDMCACRRSLFGHFEADAQVTKFSVRGELPALFRITGRPRIETNSSRKHKRRRPGGRRRFMR